MTTTTEADTPDPSTSPATERRRSTESRRSNDMATRSRTTEVPAGDVEKALRRDLARIADASQELASGALAATALALARSVDSPRTSATARSMCARALADVLGQINDQMPEPARPDDPVDVIAARRAERKAAS
jgi:hypothetical protein